MKTTTIVLIVIVVLILLLVLWFIRGYNNLVMLRNDAREGYSTMDVYLKKRFDMIPNLVETVKGYAKHEATTLEKVVSARNMVMDAKDINEKLAGENALTSTLRSLFAVAEAYPDLKANTNFNQLQRSIEDIEMEISNSRKYYNATVKMLNNACEVFPSNIIASMFKFEKMAMFEVDDVEERKNVKVSF